MTGNTAETSGAGILSNGGAFELTNTIVANNTAPSAPDCAVACTSNGYNLIRMKDGSTGFTNNVNHDLVGAGGRRT